MSPLPSWSAELWLQRCPSPAAVFDSHWSDHRAKTHWSVQEDAGKTSKGYEEIKAIRYNNYWDGFVFFHVLSRLSLRTLVASCRFTSKLQGAETVKRKTF